MQPLRYQFDVTCPYDGHPLVHENAATPGRRLAHAVTFCPNCHNRFQLRLELTLIDPPERCQAGHHWMNQPLVSAS